MAIWKRAATLEQLNQRSQGTMVAHIGIRFTALNEESIEALMPVIVGPVSRSGCCTAVLRWCWRRR